MEKGCTKDLGKDKKGILKGKKKRQEERWEGGTEVDGDPAKLSPFPRRGSVTSKEHERPAGDSKDAGFASARASVEEVFLSVHSCKAAEGQINAVAVKAALKKVPPKTQLAWKPRKPDRHHVPTLAGYSTCATLAETPLWPEGYLGS